MIYFDNAATSYPKPDCVKKAVMRAIDVYGGNPGRSGHDMSMAAAEQVFRVRQKIADMFGGQCENVIFTSNCTHSINIAVKGLAERYLRAGNDVHIITSDLEHNSVARPVNELAKCGVRVSRFKVCPSDDDTIFDLEKQISADTKAVVCTLGSNVTGQILPFRRIGELCSRYNICFIADGAQACGVVPVNMEKDRINILCAPGHKGLWGISGTGFMITDGKYPVYHIIEGGTGSSSLDLEQTDYMPDMLESGTLNTVGIISMGAGMDFIDSIGHKRLCDYEKSLCDRFLQGVRGINGVRLYRRDDVEYLPIVLFNVDGLSSEELAEKLSDMGFALRGGYHCSGLAHCSNGTMESGGVRFAPSCFNTCAQVDMLVAAVRKICG